MSYYQAKAHHEVRQQHAPAASEAKPAHRKRARHPAGDEKGGEFVGDDPATPDVNEAFAQE